jgi:predicted RNase H-like HicB family nuclease
MRPVELGCNWNVFDSAGLRECRAVVFRDGDQFVAFAAQLPGTASQGDTEAEAIKNLEEAFRGAAQSYIERDGRIPFKEFDIANPFEHIGLDEIPREFKIRCLLVNV